MAFIMSKAQYAFLRSAEVFFEQYRTVYLWTFTFKRVHADWRCQRAWFLLMRDLQDMEGKSLRGLRVAELHAEHGIHYHVLVNTRLGVAMVRRMAQRYGFGRIHVTRCNKNGAAYLAKYLTKEGRIPNIRRFGTIGGQFHVRVNDVKVDSLFHRNTQEFLGPGRRDIRMVGQVWEMTQLYGPWREWPYYWVRFGNRIALWTQQTGWRMTVADKFKISSKTVEEILASWPPCHYPLPAEFRA